MTFFSDGVGSLSVVEIVFALIAVLAGLFVGVAFNFLTAIGVCWVVGLFTDVPNWCVLVLTGVFTFTSGMALVIQQ